jgi:hypothetical protein
MSTRRARRVSRCAWGAQRDGGASRRAGSLPFSSPRFPGPPQVLDAFLVYAIATAAVQVGKGPFSQRGSAKRGRTPSRRERALACRPSQFVYMLVVGTFPFNAFLAGFLSCVGFFALTGELRGQGAQQPGPPPLAAPRYPCAAH